MRSSILSRGPRGCEWNEQRSSAGCTCSVCLEYEQSEVLDIVQEMRESRGGRPGLSVLMSLLVSVDVKNY